MSWRNGKNTGCPVRLVVIFKNYFFVWLNFTVESVNCLLFLKNLENTFLQFDLQKNFVKHIENLPQHLSEKFIGDNLLIIDIALRNWDLSVSPRALLKLSIIVIALVQKSLSCPSLAICLSRQDGGIALSAFPNNKTSELGSLLHAVPLMLNVKQGSCKYEYWSHWFYSTRNRTPIPPDKNQTLYPTWPSDRYKYRNAFKINL